MDPHDHKKMGGGGGGGGGVIMYGEKSNKHLWWQRPSHRVKERRLCDSTWDVLKELDQELFFSVGIHREGGKKLHKEELDKKKRVGSGIQAPEVFNANNGTRTPSRADNEDQT